MFLKNILNESNSNIKNLDIQTIVDYLDDTVNDLYDESIYDTVPDIEKNIDFLQRRLARSMDIPRKDMPVIRKGQVLLFRTAIQNGELDIKKPFTKGKEYYPTNLKKDRHGSEWLYLGQKDGDPNDDKLKTHLITVPVYKLQPTQSQIWLTNVISHIERFGLKIKDANDAIIIASKDGYILDGHHRYARQVMIDLKSELKCLVVPVDIKHLLKFARSYGNAIGNTQNR